MSRLPSRRQPARLTNLTLAAVLMSLLPLALTCLPGTAAPAGAEAAAEQSAPGLSIEVLPPIDQPGAEAARSARAVAVVVVTVDPREAGLRVTLQGLIGSHWSRIGTERTRAGGRATFLVRDHRAITSYRASTAASRDRPGTSRLVEAPGWGRPVFVDEFDGDQLGPAWSHRTQFYNPWGGRSCSKGDPSAVSVSGGTLRLSSLVDPAAVGSCSVVGPDGQPRGSYPYRLNANISTQQSFDFQYGVAAARMRFPRSLGQHAAFWLQPRGLLETGPTPWGAEVDVVEYYGARAGRSRLGSTVYAPLPSGEKQQIGGMVKNPDRFLESRSDRWWTRFHVFSVEWTPTEYVFRVNGREVWRTAQGVSDVPEFLILSMLSSDYELPDAGTGPDPRTAEVDWVACWQAP